MGNLWRAIYTVQSKVGISLVDADQALGDIATVLTNQNSEFPSVYLGNSGF